MADTKISDEGLALALSGDDRVPVIQPSGSPVVWDNATLTLEQLAEFLGSYPQMMSGFIQAPSNKTYRIVVKATHGGTITETTTISASGTCTATFKINTTALGGTANSVSSSEESQAHASANDFVAGDDIQITISANSSCADMSFTIKYTRTPT